MQFKSIRHLFPWAAGCAIAIAPNLAFSQTTSGPYVSFGLGANELQNQEITRVGTPFGNAPTGNVKSELGSALALAAGWRFGNGIRVEAEGSWRDNKAWQATAGALRNAEAAGHQKQSSAFLNVLYDFDAQCLGVFPYLGVGVGSVSSKWDNVVSYKPGERVRFNDTQSNSAHQLIVGGNFLRNFKPGWSFNVEYHFVQTRGDRVYNGRIEESRFGSFPVTVTVPRSRNHSLMLGLRYAFGAGQP